MNTKPNMQASKRFRLLFFIAVAFSLASCAYHRSPPKTDVYKTNDFCKNRNKRYQTYEDAPYANYTNHYAYRLAHYRKKDKNYLVNMLFKNNIQFIQYKDSITLIVPSDQYFDFNTNVLNEREETSLNYIVNLIHLYPCTSVYVAAFSDNIGPRHARNFKTQAQAESMLGYLWANSIPAEYLSAEGFGSRYPIADNTSIRGSAMNRRLEIQWTVHPDDSADSPEAINSMLNMK
jgi:outer membrane protein OmpA-like peptidoglycan-associated protein